MAVVWCLVHSLRWRRAIRGSQCLCCVVMDSAAAGHADTLSHTERAVGERWLSLLQLSDVLMHLSNESLLLRPCMLELSNRAAPSSLR